ncbi:ogr/Delta-like zinc finger family protein [Sphingomonas sp. VDB2]|uniref:ogr/Delta-like zinc finger family protein n=1 Tax=Sphingomonas sp. VDB2 TaxID=3228751 RepID=UPI003A80982D
MGDNKALQTSSGENPRMPGVDCPACGRRAFARASGKRSLLYREFYYHCRDIIDCGHQFVVGMSALRTIRPSRKRPLEMLPITDWRTAANDRAANDDGPPTEPAMDAMTT